MIEFILWGIAILCALSIFDRYEPTTEEKWGWSIVAGALFITWAVHL